jgi:hypothetical protein
MRSWRVFAAVGTVVALVVTFYLGHALGVCWSDSAPSSYQCPGGGGGCLSGCTFWSPAFLIGPAIGLMVVTIAAIVMRSVAQQRA